MASDRRTFSRIILLTGQIILLLNAIYAYESHNDQIRTRNLFIENFNTTEIIKRISSHHWIVNQECVNELNAIINGRNNRQLWAVKGKFELHNK